MSLDDITNATTLGMREHANVDMSTGVSVRITVYSDSFRCELVHEGHGSVVGSGTTTDNAIAAAISEMEAAMIRA